LGGTAELAGLAAAGMGLPGQRPVIVSRLPDDKLKAKGMTASAAYVLNAHKDFALKGTPRLFMRSGKDEMCVLLCEDTSPADALQQLQQLAGPSLSSKQHNKIVKYSVVVSLPNFLQQQPEHYKFAARVVHKWVTTSSELKGIPELW
jgi:hypothetical protein